jgi:quercetin dioxygenase-like cupin family protein
MNHFIELNKLEIIDRLSGTTATYFQAAYSTIAYTEMKAGAEVPPHQHIQEAIDIVLEGELEMQIGENTGLLKQGMMSFVPPGILHRAKAVTDCKVVTVLHPKR